MKFEIKVIAIEEDVEIIMMYNSSAFKIQYMSTRRFKMSYQIFNDF